MLVLTVDTTAAAIERALRDGAQDFIAKPFNETEVLLHAQNLLENRFMYTTRHSSIVLAREGRRQCTCRAHPPADRW